MIRQYSVYGFDVNDRRLKWWQGPEVGGDDEGKIDQSQKKKEGGPRDERTQWKTIRHCGRQRFQEGDEWSFDVIPPREPDCFGQGDTTIIELKRDAINSPP